MGFKTITSSNRFNGLIKNNLYSPFQAQTLKEEKKIILHNQITIKKGSQ